MKNSWTQGVAGAAVSTIGLLFFKAAFKMASPLCGTPAPESMLVQEFSAGKTS